MQSNPNDNELELHVENLEPRMMLSAVQIFAAGTTGQEVIEVAVNDQKVALFNDLGDGAYSNQFKTLSFQTDSPVAASDVKISFLNDVYDVANGIDRNVRIDAIVIDGVRFEAESPDVYSTGTWKAEDGIQAGFRLSEYLHADGYLQFSGDAVTPTATGSVLEVRARGDEGGEQMRLLVGEVEVGIFTVTKEEQTFVFQADGNVAAEDVRIEFINDVYDPANNVDANLFIDYISIDGQVHQTEDSSTFSTGTWAPEDGIVDGFRQSEYLHTNGYFQFKAKGKVEPPVEPPTPQPAPPATFSTENLIENGSFESIGRETKGYERVNANEVDGWQTINGQPVEVWNSGEAGVTPTDGNKAIELDVGLKQDGIFQDIDTNAGQAYVLTFDMRARTANITSNSETVVVEWNGVKTNADGYRANEVNRWTRHTVIVYGTGGTDRLLLRESTLEGANDEVGPILDNVSLRELDNSQNYAPFVTNDIVVAVKNSPTGGSVATNDVDPNGDQVIYQLFAPAENGTVQLAPDGQFSYVPEAGFVGQDSFLYKAIDQKGGEAITRVDVAVVSLLTFDYQDAKFQNIVGTYELDANGNPTNLQVIIGNTKRINNGTVIGAGTELPRIFVIGDGGKFASGDSGTKITWDGANSVLVDGQSIPLSTAWTDTKFNADGKVHVIYETNDKGETSIRVEDRVGKKSKLPFGLRQLIGFNDRSGGNPDFDYNDVVLKFG